MASPTEPLLSSPKPSRRVSCKLVGITISLVAVISLSSLAALQFSTYQQPQLSDLCTDSPNPASCHSVVSDALLVGGRRPTRLRVFHTLLDKSLSALDSTIAAANAANTVMEQSALADCLTLMDRSYEHLNSASSAASAGAHSDARTYISAVLTNHVTCLDSLNGSASPALETHLDGLISLASASLAVLNSVSPSSDLAIEPIVHFPTWLAHRDRKLLEVSLPKAVKANVVVAQDGSGSFKTVQEAVNAAPSKGSSRYVIYVKKGIYKENVNIGNQKTNIMLVGDGMDATIITGSLNNVDGTSTFQSATLAAVGDGLILQDLKIENTAGAVKHQAVALRVGADRAVINRCNIAAYQDTLYAYSLRQFYRDCTISGTVDFIFGNAAVVFQNCNIIARKPLNGQKNTVTAQGRTDPNQNTATSIQNCQILAANDLGSTPTYLGRPWKAYSRTVYLESYLGALIDPKGWLEWSGDFALNTLYYGEYQNKGPGAGTAGRVKWAGYKVITDVSTAQSFTVAKLIQGGSWLGATGVTFTEGL